MSPIFGRKDEEKRDGRSDQGETGQSGSWQESLEAEFDRLNALPLPQLAAEVMTAAFTPGCPGANDDEYVSVAGGNAHAGPSAYRIAELLMKSRGVEFPYGPMKERTLQERIVRLVAEGLQQLEHASFVRAQVHEPPQSGPDYTITRRGRVALEQGEIEGALTAANS